MLRWETYNIKSEETKRGTYWFGCVLEIPDIRELTFIQVDGSELEIIRKSFPLTEFNLFGDTRVKIFFGDVAKSLIMNCTVLSNAYSNYHAQIQQKKLDLDVSNMLKHFQNKKELETQAINLDITKMLNRFPKTGLQLRQPIEKSEVDYAVTL